MSNKCKKFFSFITYENQFLLTCKFAKNSVMLNIQINL